MLFIVLLVFLIIVFLIHVTKVQLVGYLKRGDINGALRILQMFDKID